MSLLSGIWYVLVAIVVYLTISCLCEYNRAMSHSSVVAGRLSAPAREKRGVSNPRVASASSQGSSSGAAASPESEVQGQGTPSPSPLPTTLPSTREYKFVRTEQLAPLPYSKEMPTEHVAAHMRTRGKEPDWGDFYKRGLTRSVESHEQDYLKNSVLGDPNLRPIGGSFGCTINRGV